MALEGLCKVHATLAWALRCQIAAGRQALRHFLFEAALAAAYHNPVLKPVAQRLEKRGKLQNIVILAITCRLVTNADTILKTGNPWQSSPIT